MYILCDKTIVAQGTVRISDVYIIIIHVTNAHSSWATYGQNIVIST